MGKLTFLIVAFQIYSVQCCQNFQNDYLVLGNNGAQCAHAGSTRREERAESQLAGFLNEFAVLSFRPFSSIPDGSRCQTQMRAVLQEAEKLSLWALRMLDASAKLPSGILSGNLNQFGDFEECINSKGVASNNLIEGKYCLVNIDIRTVRNRTNEKIKNLDAAIHSNWILHSEFRDQGHRIPKFETFNLGVCVPAACYSEEIENALSEQLNEKFKNDFFGLRIAVDDDLCYVKESRNVSVTGSAVRFLFVFVLTLVVLGTLVEMKRITVLSVKLSRILECFSLRKSLNLLLKTEPHPDDISCIHGARFLNAIALLLSHKQMAMLFSPFVNRTSMSESFSKSWTMIGRAAILYTDSFILFSGLLASYSMIKDLDRKKTTNFKDKLISRIFRLTPNLICVILFCTYVMDAMGSGPQWGLVVTKYTDLCKRFMWRNFLFVHNYFGFENMCLTHTHQLGIDMQLFFLSPLFIYLIWKMPKTGAVVMVGFAAGSTWLRYDRTHRENLSTLLYYGISVEQLWKTANTSYILPTHRLTVYLTGVLLGYFLRRGGRSLNFSSFQASLGWILAVSAGLSAVFGPYQAAYKEYEYDVDDAARFNAFAPILWTAFLSWGIIASLNGCGGLLNDFLSWKYFTVFTRISYALYLTQFPVFFYNVGTQRTAKYYKGFHSLFDFTELSVIFIASLVLTLTIDIPFQELKKTLMTPTKLIQTKTVGKEVEKTSDEETKRKEGRKRLQFFGT